MIFWDFLRFFQIFGFFDHFWQFLDFLGFLWIFWIFLDFLGFFWIFWIFFGFFWFFGRFLDFWIFWIFLKFLDFFWIFFFLVIVTNVTTKSYQGYYWTPKIAKNGPKQYNKLFFCPKGKKSLGRRPKPSAGARSKPA